MRKGNKVKLMSVIKRIQPNQFSDTVKRVKAHFYLPSYVAKLTKWVKGSGPGYWYTFCPLCQREETRVSKHKFWLNRDVCGCFNPKCKLNQGSHDVIALHAMLNSLTLGQAIGDLAKQLN
jgi:hypothetical protein